jgi:L-ascorbate metabolism protein UlaG (beta-lactamase superfamily)
MFLETQFRRVLSNIFTKYKYFSHGENKNPKQIYKYAVPNPIENDLKIQNIGHATLLIQVNTFNILTDPIFGNLNSIFYRAQTRSGLEPDDLPKLDVIMISHNHRDHLDIPSLKKFIKHQPTVIVPIGDGNLVRKLGFENVIETTWHDEVTFTKIDKTGKEKQITITATLANHWTKRNFFDRNTSLVNGYLIAPHANDRAGMIYFAGDTAVMDDKYIKEIATVLRLQMINYDIAPEIITLAPSGPNYRRTLMQSAHQSTIEAIITTLKLTQAIIAIEKQMSQGKKSKIKPLKSPLEWLGSICTIFIHHNKFDLGADRFNESLIIMDKMLRILAHPKLIKYNKKDAFIWQGAHDLLQAYIGLLGDSSKDYTNKQETINGLLEFINNKVIFPLIGAQVPGKNKSNG